jgi:hypothetical protein
MDYHSRDVADAEELLKQLRTLDVRLRLAHSGRIAMRCDSLPAAAAAGCAMCRRVRAWQEDTAAALDRLEREGLVECRARAAKLGCARTTRGLAPAGAVSLRRAGDG